ncbi:hypothetical protein DH2020_040967 [Rehmannia glutinosa]|uniref:Uncharacterized protein n=1 Tax=Rehmannia glutinosa TaxID=99300 RepID=A0ABR0UTI7_REHGL
MELAELTYVRNGKVRVNRKALEVVLQQCLQQIACSCDDDGNADVAGELDAPQDSIDTSAPSRHDPDTVEVKLYGLLKSRFECADFITKLEHAQALPQQNMAEEGSSWDMDLTPNQLQEALRKTFSLEKKKGKLRKAWDGSKSAIKTGDAILLPDTVFLCCVEQNISKPCDFKCCLSCILDFMPRAIKAIVRCISDSERPLLLDLTALELTALV